VFLAGLDLTWFSAACRLPICDMGDDMESGGGREREREIARARARWELGN
jgi:hypothetical protein